MEPIEKAIRNAFEKGNASDQAFREKVYRSAFAALDRALKANPGLTVEVAIKRRKALQAKIAEIESEFVAGGAAIDPASSEVAPSLDDVRPGGGDAAFTAPDIAGERRQNAGRGKTRRADAAAAKAERGGRRARRSRSPLLRLLVSMALLAAIGLAGWGALRSGIWKMPTRDDIAQIGKSLAPTNEGAPALSGQADPNRAWIEVFSPADPTGVTAPAGTSAEVMQDGSGSFLRMRSGGSDAAILFDVGQGVLERLAGKQAIFDIVARGADGKQTQMSVDCNFGELGDCGRKRYAVSQDRGDYLFELDFRSIDPGSGGTIAVNTDVGGQGKSVDIYEIRVSVSQ
ncbi:hypothetical protein [Mesorhizobium sp. KR2-14]|uniref:hypothetical protein n=1 Tax=Mesorhizobium sp. KR2-14 TaxID=3156610 RepID=UPI0032B4E2AF